MHASKCSDLKEQNKNIKRIMPSGMENISV